jgi:predicted dehydrogenase
MTRWGIMGAGRIASALVDAILEAGGEVVAIGSSSGERAEAFGERHGIPHRYSSHAEVALDADVDVVYVASTNDAHHAHTLTSIAAGKPVLCEKPFALNTPQAMDMVTAARESDVFLMEAMWMRFQPATDHLMEMLGAGRIGAARVVQVDFGFPAAPHASNRLFDPALGGGTIMDLGVYVVTLATMVLGPPEQIMAQVERFESGVDRQAGIVLHHRRGGISTLSTSFVADTSTEAIVSGPEGRIRVHRPFHHSPMLTVERGGETVETVDVGYQGSGYRFEVEEVHRCLREGLTESPKMPLDTTLNVMETLDEIRAQVGLTFPGE